MSAPLSVIVPTLDAAARIGPCLGAIGEGLFEGLIHEVIIADGGSSDAIGAIADETGARLVTASRGRGSQLAAGARAARAEWFLFLHADCVLPPGWPDPVRRHIATAPGRAGYFRLAFRTRHPMARAVAAWGNLRSALFGLPYGDQGLLIPRRLYERAGGYPEIPIMEDVALARRLRGRLRAIPATITTSAERYERDGWLRRGARNLGTLALYLAGRAPERLVARYERQ